MTIEIRIIDIIYLGIAFGGVIFCFVLHFYDRHQVAKWFKDNAKEDDNEEDNE